MHEQPSAVAEFTDVSKQRFESDVLPPGEPAVMRDQLGSLSAENPNPLLDPAIEQLVSLWIGNRARTARH